MGSGKGKGASQRYFSEEAHQANLEKQVTWSPKTLQQLRNFGVSDQSLLKLEFVFYTDEETKSRPLTEALSNKGYEVKDVPSATHETRRCVTGWTTKLRMDESTVVGWTREMCQLGYEHDAEFDGWGTHPQQAE
jgi:regulator of RNase E activity RraB